MITREEAEALGRGRIEGIDKHIRPYRNGRDLTQQSRDVYVIDLLGLQIDEVRHRFPEIYQWLLERVKPEREAKANTPDGAGYARFWWLLGKPRQGFRPALEGLDHYIASPMTAKHRIFQSLPIDVLPDQGLIAFALDDAYFLGVLSSRIHVLWSLSAGGRLGVGNDPRYNNSRCFDTFPFPTPTDPQAARIRDLGEQLDAHRKRQQAQHADLTLTDMYNVLEKLRSGEVLTAKERATNERGLVAVLRQLHDELDAAVAEAYGWPADLAAAEILERLVALNAEREAEEARGLVRWLRPEYQARGQVETQAGLEGVDVASGGGAAAAPQAKRPWPAALPERVQALLSVLGDSGQPLTGGQAADAFAGGAALRGPEVAELLATLEALGLVRELDGGRWVRG